MDLGEDLKVALQRQALTLQNLRGMSDMIAEMEVNQDRIEREMKSVRVQSRDTARHLSEVGGKADDCVRTLADCVDKLKAVFGSVGQAISSTAMIYKKIVKGKDGFAGMQDELALANEFIRAVMAAIRSK